MDYTVDGHLFHYGVKGMKWGVRRAEKNAARAAPSKVTEKVKASRRGSEDIRVRNKHGGRVSTAGGRRNVATADAVKAAVNRQKAKASSTNALSNKELKETVERMNLEVQFAKLNKEEKRINRGSKMVEALFKFATGDLVGGAASTASAAVPERRAIGR